MDYETNPPIVARFTNLVSYKNGRNGAIAERVGAVQFHNFKTADNKLAGMEFSLTEDIEDGWAKIVGGLVVGRSENSDAELDGLSVGPHGIITPRTENFSVEGTSFFNFDFWEDGAALGTCSHCFHGAATDSGARTVTVKSLTFDRSVPKRIRYQYPFRAIFYDLDGSLTGQSKKSWATPYWKHNEQPECSVSLDQHDGIVCPRSVQVRRVAFHGYEPGSFQHAELRITRLEPDDEERMADNGSLEAYLDDKENYSNVPFKPKLKPSNGWAMPYVTGHRYRIHWGSGLDFTRMKVEVSERW